MRVVSCLLWAHVRIFIILPCDSSQFPPLSSDLTHWGLTVVSGQNPMWFPFRLERLFSGVVLKLTAGLIIQPVHLLSPVVPNLPAQLFPFGSHFVLFWGFSPEMVFAFPRVFVFGLRRMRIWPLSLPPIHLFPHSPFFFFFFAAFLASSPVKPSSYSKSPTFPHPF